MKAQELRIGNWVEFMGKDKQITQEIFNEICENNATALEIPLTEEWLLKLPDNLVYPDWIKYVHDLQNWYYYNNKKIELVFK